MALKLIIGDKHLSSWSLRPWLALSQFGVAFEETVIRLDRPDTAEKIRAHSPAGRVPTLIDDGFAVWDSLAIVEHVAATQPQAGQWWPAGPRARARARSLCAEMHAGFATLRMLWPMQFASIGLRGAWTPDLARDVARIDAMWEGTRAEFGAGGPFLFGAFSIADAFYAPVVSRFMTYRADRPRPPAVQSYMDAVWSLPAMQRWGEGARAELG